MNIEIPYCDSEILKEELLTTKPISGLYPHEIYIIVYIKSLKPLISSNINVNSRFWYVLKVNDFVRNMIERGYLCIKKDENIVECVKFNELRKLLKDNNIKCPAKRIDCEKLIKEKFDYEFIVNYFNEGYYSLTEKSEQYLKENAKNIFNQIKKNKDKSSNRYDLECILENIDSKNYEKIYGYNIFQYLINYNLLKTRCSREKYINSDILDNTYNNVELDCYVDDEDLNYYYANSDNFFSKTFFRDTVPIYGAFYSDIKKINIYYMNKLLLTLSKVVYIDLLKSTNCLFIMTDAPFINYYDIFIFDFKKNNYLFSSRILEKEKMNYINMTFDKNVININEISTNKNNKSYGFYVSTNNEISDKIINFLSKKIIIKPIPTLFYNENYNNYLICIGEKNEYFKLVIYLICNYYFNELKICGKSMNSFFRILHIKRPLNEVESCVVMDQIQSYYKYNEFSNLIFNIISLPLNEKNNLANKIILDYKLSEYLDYRNTNYNNSYWNLKNDILKNNAKYNYLLDELKSECVIPLRWKNEFELYLLTKKFFQDAIFQYRVDWLGAQSIDIYIPTKRIGIEYQGIQHYKDIEFFGGKDNFEKRKNRDINKKNLCIENNVYLIEWKYDIEVNEKNFKKILSGYNIKI